MTAVEGAIRPALPDFDAPLSRQPSQGLRIAVDGLSRSFGAVPVLNRLDLDIEPGQFLAIVGRSGCGKSTLLRILAGLDRQSAGLVDVGGATEPAAIGAVSRLMFQEPRLLPWASVLANVEVGLGDTPRDARSRARSLEALAAVGLADRALEWPAVLSGGQKQRVALARALVSEPRFLALDEPLGALDALTRIEMQGLLERVWLKQGFTAVLVTHDVTEALTLADRVVMIEQGRIALDVTVDLPRPRRRSDADLARLEERILAKLILEDSPQPEYVI